MYKWYLKPGDVSKGMVQGLSLGAHDIWRLVRFTAIPQGKGWCYLLKPLLRTTYLGLEGNRKPGT